MLWMKSHIQYPCYEICVWAGAQKSDQTHHFYGAISCPLEKRSVAIIWSSNTFLHICTAIVTQSSITMSFSTARATQASQAGRWYYTHTLHTTHMSFIHTQALRQLPRDCTCVCVCVCVCRYVVMYCFWQRGISLEKCSSQCHTH